MHTSTYLQRVQASKTSRETRDVLMGAMNVARYSFARDFVDPVDALLSSHKLPGLRRLNARLTGAGLSFDALDECAAAMNREMSSRRSHPATDRMFTLAGDVVGARVSDKTTTPPFGVGDLVLSAIAAKSCVIDTLVRDGLQKSIAGILDELGAPSSLMLLHEMGELTGESEWAAA